MISTKIRKRPRQDEDQQDDTYKTETKCRRTRLEMGESAEEQRPRSSSTFIAPEIWRKILSYLPSKDVLRAMCLDKRTCSLIRSNWRYMQKTRFHCLYLEAINDTGSVLLKMLQKRENCILEMFSYEIDHILTDDDEGQMFQITNVNSALRSCLQAIMKQCGFEIIETNGLCWQLLEVADAIKATQCHIDKIVIEDKKNCDEEFFTTVSNISDIVRFSGCTELECSNITLLTNVWAEHEVMQQLNSVVLQSVNSAPISTKQLLSFPRLTTFCFEGENDFNVNTLNAVLDQWFQKQREIDYMKFIMCISLDELSSVFDLISVFTQCSMENKTHYFLSRNKDFRSENSGNPCELLQVCIENYGDEYEQEITFIGNKEVFSLDRTLLTATTLQNL